VTDLMVKEGLINLDFADVRSVMRGMGKAMMGTGEATGDRRAILSAEAAIANPLLDEVSMKGARGVLISITGGNDLTLYEVDEAASRIRQEVDEDANIILGATFDESLEGAIRVSVVATGIDPASITVQDTGVGVSEQRLAEAAERLRAQAAQQVQQRILQPVVSEPVAQAAPAPAPVAPAPAPVYYPQERAPAPAYAPMEPPAQPAPAYYNEAPAAPAQAAAPRGVYIEPAPARAAAVYAEPPREPAHYADERAPYIPPAPEQPLRTQRIPQIEDFPKPLQDQIRAQRGDAPAPDARRRSIFERLAQFGSSRTEDALLEAAHANAQQAPARPQAPPAPTATHAEYAKRPSASMLQGGAHAGLDPHGRRVAPTRAAEEDQLEIPAFLRRQQGS